MTQTWTDRIESAKQRRGFSDDDWKAFINFLTCPVGVCALSLGLDPDGLPYDMWGPLSDRVCVLMRELDFDGLLAYIPEIDTALSAYKGSSKA